MKFLQQIAGFIAILGVILISGATEFCVGMFVGLAMLLIGATAFYLIEKNYYFER